MFSFKGRIPRRQYWGGTLIAAVFYIGALALTGGFSESEEVGMGLAVATIGIVIVYIWMALALSIKRWHDRNKSGWMVLISLIPIVGAIWTFIENGCLRGTEGPNNYGEDPT